MWFKCAYWFCTRISISWNQNFVNQPTNQQHSADWSILWIKISLCFHSPNSRPGVKKNRFISFGSLVNWFDNVNFSKVIGLPFANNLFLF